ncbi:MAG: glutamate--tRNA ligase family protein [Nitritalea sp.]
MTPLTPYFRLTRYAPTPSGYLHLGNLFNFLETLRLARFFKARILLRIDDADEQRCRPEYVADIFESLTYLGLPYDFGPRSVREFEGHFKQVYRMPLYREAFLRLKRQGKVYACSCTRKEIAEETESDGYPGTCRDKAPAYNPGPIAWRHRSEATLPVYLPAMRLGPYMKPLAPSIRDAIIWRKDDVPAYQLSSIVDDAFFGVDLWVRGLDLEASSHFQFALAKDLDYSAFRQTAVYHHDLLRNAAGEKLAKSEGATSLWALRESGTAPGQVFRLLADRLGIAGQPESAEAFIRCRQQQLERYGEALTSDH